MNLGRNKIIKYAVPEIRTFEYLEQVWYFLLNFKHHWHPCALLRLTVPFIMPESLHKENMEMPLTTEV